MYGYNTSVQASTKFTPFEGGSNIISRRVQIFHDIKFSEIFVPRGSISDWGGGGGGGPMTVQRSILIGTPPVLYRRVKTPTLMNCRFTWLVDLKDLNWSHLNFST